MASNEGGKELRRDGIKEKTAGGLGLEKGDVGIIGSERENMLIGGSNGTQGT